jgi:prepilin-type N-terminal cleavage/methylation domain-containing protein
MRSSAPEGWTMTIRSAFTYIEIMIVIVILAILTIAALPDRESTIQAEGERAALMFEADVDYARSRSIARPDSPIGIKVAIGNNKYWLAPVVTPDTPIAHPQTGQPYVRQFGAAGPDGLKNVQITALDLGGDDILKFDALGGTDQQIPALVQFEAGLAAYETKVSPAAANVTTTKKETTNSEKLAVQAAKDAEKDAKDAQQGQSK